MQPHWITAARDGRCAECRRPVLTGEQLYAASAGRYLCELCGSIKEHEEPSVGKIEGGVIESLKRFPPEAAESALGQGMLYLARQLDEHDVSSRDVPNFTKEIRQGMAQLAIEYPPVPEDDTTDQARKRRERKLTGLDEEF